MDTEYIFHNAKGEVQNPNHFSVYVFNAFMSDMVQLYQKFEVGIPALNSYKLRHTAAPLWGLFGVNPYTIAKLGGWSDLEMVSKVYRHTDVEAIRRKMVQKIKEESASN